MTFYGYQETVPSSSSFLFLIIHPISDLCRKDVLEQRYRMPHQKHVQEWDLKAWIACFTCVLNQWQLMELKYSASKTISISIRKVMQTVRRTLIRLIHWCGEQSYCFSADFCDVLLYVLLQIERHGAVIPHPTFDKCCFKNFLLLLTQTIETHSTFYIVTCKRRAYHTVVAGEFE